MAWPVRTGTVQRAIFFAAFGFAVRLQRSWSVRAAAGCIVSILILLCTYQALALCLLALPLFARMWRGTSPSNNRSNMLVAWRPEIRIALTIVTAFCFYGFYAFWISRGASGGGYEAGLAADSVHLLTIDGMSTHIGHVYQTAFGVYPALLPLLVVLAFYLAASHVHAAEGSRTEFAPAWLIAGVVLCLPLFSLIYVNDAHAHDPDRVIYPVSVAFVMLATALIGMRRAAATSTADRTRATVVVGVLLVASLLVACSVKKYANVRVRSSPSRST